MNRNKTIDLKKYGIIEDLKETKGKKGIKARIISRKILKPNKMEVHIRERTPENVWEKQNMFFKGNYEKEKRSMFLE